ncbi:MAG: tetratricopeptide repeat protein, partial [Chthoniobacterales bacterium]
KYAARLYRTGDVSGDPIFAHDDWLQFAAEYGFVGMAILIVVSVTALGACARGFLSLVRVASTETGSALSSSGAFVLGAGCALVAAAVHGNVDFNMHVPANALLAAALLGLVTGVRPAEYERKVSHFRPLGWLVAATALAAACGLGTILVKRGEGEYHALQAENAMSRVNVKLALDETDKGLARLPDDPALLAMRARGLYEYESWLQMTTPGKVVNEPEPEKADDENSDDDAEFNEETEVQLSPEESAKNYRESAEIYERLVKVQPLERQHYSQLARALLALERNEDARREFIKAIQLDPWHAYAWANYGDYLVELDRPVDARRIFDIGAQLPNGHYARTQVESIDDDMATEKEMSEEEGRSQ